MLYETGHGRGYLSRNRRGPVRHLGVDLFAPSSWGYVNDPIVWNSAMDAYLADRLEPAFAIVEGRGIGDAGDYLEFSRILEGELALGTESEIVKLSDNVELETSREDLGIDPAELGKVVLAEVAETERVLETPRATPTMVTILLRGTFIPTTLLAGGYYVEKAEYGKICIPAEIADDLEAFRWAIRRGVCYQILYPLAEGEACRWFLEAATAAVSPPTDPGLVAQLRSSAEYWLDPEELEHVFQSETRDDDEGVGLAFEQAHALGRVLLRQGAAKLAECARAHSSGLGFGKGYPDATDHALNKVYGIDEETLFRAAWAG